MAVWTTPRTWATGELVTATLLNEELRDKFEALRTPPTVTLVTTSNLTTSSTTFVDVSATQLSLDITTTGADLLVGFFGDLIENSAFLDVSLDGTRIGDTTNGIMRGLNHVSFVLPVTGVSAAAHTLRLSWKRDTFFSTDAELRAGATFWVREFS